MKLLCGVGFVVLFLTACSTSSGGTTSAAGSAQPSASAATTYSLPQAMAASCAAFEKFFADLNRLTPHGSQGILENDAGAVLDPLIHTTGYLTGRARKLDNDAGDLVMHIGSASWPTKGTPVDRQIMAVQADCG